MNIYVPSRGVSDWQRLLADPVKHWATGYSARTMAHCWEAAEGFPPEIARVLSQHAAFADIEPLFIVPERQVALDSHRAPSQNDAWVLAKATSGLVSIAVEGKVKESFDVTLDEWRETASKGRATRLEFLTKTLALTKPIPGSIRYQLLHRTASAVIEAQRFGAAHAVIRTPQECENFGKNATDRNRPDLAKEAQLRAIQLRAEQYGAKSQAEREALEAVYAYEEVLSKKNGRRTRASRTWQMIGRHGIIGAVERAVDREQEAQGYTALVEMDLQELAFEAVILRYPSLFSEAAVAKSKERLRTWTGQSTGASDAKRA